MSGILHEAVTPDVYHADGLLDAPTLSGSIAHILCSRSPAHARAAHPKLNPDFVREVSDRFDLGTVAHAVFLEEGGKDVQVVPEESWRSKRAQETRDYARAEGKIALLEKDWERVRSMVFALAQSIRSFRVDPPMFTEGSAEATITWEEDGGVQCRARLDWLRHDKVTVDDYKTTSGSAHPDSWSKTLFSTGADVKAAFYLRGLAAIAPDCEAVDRRNFRWLVQETRPPFAASVLTLSEAGWTLAEEKANRAIALWRACLESDEWPSYSLEMALAEPPPWEMMKWMEASE